MKAQITCVICAFLFCFSNGNAQITFDKSYDYNSYLEFAYSVQITSDSDYFPFAGGVNIQTGLQHPLLFYKVNQEGLSQGLSAVDGDSLYWYPGLSGSLVHTHDGNFVGGGSVSYPSSKSYGVLVKYNSIPDTLLLKKYEYSDVDFFYNNVETSDHGFALVGISATYDSTKPYGEQYDDDIWLVKTDSAGTLQAQATYGDTADDVAIVISEILGKRLLFSGVKKISSTNYTPWILITDFSGNLLKEKTLTKPKYKHCGGGFIIPAKDVAYIFRGYIDTTINYYDNPCPPFISKMDTDFNFLWQTIYSDSLIGEIWNVRQLQDSSIVFAGFKGPNYFGWIGKLDKNGNKMWEREFQHGTSTFNIFADFQQTPWDKGFILTGSTVDSYNQNIWLVKVDSNGMLLPDTISSGTFEIGGDNFELQAFPNPASSQTTLLYNISPQTKSAALQIFNLSGQLIEEISLDKFQHQYQLSVRNWSAGMYLCELVADGERVKTVKLLVSY